VPKRAGRPREGSADAPADDRIRRGVVLADETVVAHERRVHRQRGAARGKGWVGRSELAEINRLLLRLMALMQPSRTSSRDSLTALSWILAPVEAKPSRRTPRAGR
jgi:hypothetical protein